MMEEKYSAYKQNPEMWPEIGKALQERFNHKVSPKLKEKLSWISADTLEEALRRRGLNSGLEGSRALTMEELLLGLYGDSS
jgi:hypothetical protein